MAPLIVLGKTLPPTRGPGPTGPAWVQARLAWIDRALAASQARPTGGWFVLDASRRIDRRPRGFAIAGVPLVVFRDRAGEVIAGPDRCPHMGARLCDGRVEGDAVVCPWHGLALGAAPHGSWAPVPTHDDGVLVWIRLAEPGQAATARPILAPRPPTFVDAVVRLEARCDPADVIANRLDPWHGPHLHPYAFARLAVLERGEDHVVVRVATRIIGPVAIEVDARFHSPEPRTIVMTIVAGTGQGSVVETHATPIAPGRTAIVEVALAHAAGPGFRIARPLTRLLRPLLERSAHRLWIDDGAYAERRFELRQRAPVRERAPA